MKIILRTLILCVFSVLALPVAVFAQAHITTATISGTVADESGAVIPGANVEARNVETNAVQVVMTDNDGRFVLLQLTPGNYTVTVTKGGYATLVQENLEMTVGKSLTLNLKLKVSTVTETVTITASPVIDTAKTEASSTLDQRSVSNTPILGRKFEDLLTLTPGVSIVQGPDGDEINFAGQRGIFNNVSLDGGDYNNGFFAEQMGGQRAAIDITLEAVKEFQVVATGASAEFGRTAGGVVNVITKSGTNEFHGSAFYFQRLEALSSDTSDGKPLKDFRREQFGGTFGGPIIKDKMFFFGAVEQIKEKLTRPNLSEAIGTPCSVAAPTVPANEALINSSPDCQRLALINFFKTRFGQDESLPVKHPLDNTAVLAKYDWQVNAQHKVSASYNFDRSDNENQTFDVPTYGTSANGTEGPSKIHAFNFNLYSTLSPTLVNELHFTYSREERPREATKSNLLTDVAMGFAPTFRFGNPFFLQPNVDELFWRTQVKDNISIVKGKHTPKAGWEWVHSRNTQVFRGFFTGRYLFDSVAGFLRYASPSSMGPGFGPTTVGCSNGTYVDVTGKCPAGSTATGGPLLLFLQHAATSGPTTDATGASNIKNEEFSLFAQDQYQIRPNLTLNYGLRWDAQIFPTPLLAPGATAYGPNLADPRFPSDGKIHNQTKMFQPRIGFAWDIFGNARSVLRGSWGIYNARQNMLTQVGALTTNGVQQQTIVAGSVFNTAGGLPPTFPGVVVPPPLPPGTLPFQPGITVFSEDYANPRVYTANAGFEQQIVANWVAYLDFTWSKGVHLTRFINPNVGSTVVFPTTGDTVSYTGPKPFQNLGDITDTVSSAKSLYRGFTVGVRKRFVNHFQLEGNYTLSKDLDDDSNERDPFTFRYFNLFDLQKDYAYSDRDIRHKFNFYAYAELPWGFQATGRIQARSAQPITPSPRVVNGIDQGRNSLRKDNDFFSLDWRVLRPIKLGERVAITPILEMFNTTNSKNNVNPLVSPALFNFDGFLRQGVGDPRQLQLAVRFTF
jgi:hypothetical protein